MELSASPAFAAARAARDFCTIVHRFAQRFDQNLIDGANGKNYFASRLNREA
jgi:hypothetical protein